MKVFVLLLLVACKTDNAPQPSPSPSPSTAAASPSPSASPSMAAQPSPSASPSASPSEQPAGPPGASIPPGSIEKAPAGVVINEPASPTVIDAMRTLCPIGGSNPEAVKKWVAENVTNKELADLIDASLKGDAAATMKLHNAADTAVGPGRCADLDAMLRATKASP